MHQPQVPGLFPESAQAGPVKAVKTAQFLLCQLVLAEFCLLGQHHQFLCGTFLQQPGEKLRFPPALQRLMVEISPVLPPVPQGKPGRALQRQDQQSKRQKQDSCADGLLFLRWGRNVRCILRKLSLTPK